MHLVISDAHVALGDDLTRFDALANLIMEVRPDRIICIGDFGTFDSCSFYESQDVRPTLDEDIAVVNEALRRMFGPLDRYNARRRKSKHGQYTPSRDMLLGNHEERIDRQCRESPLLAQIIRDPAAYVGYTKFFDRVYPYKEYVEIDGINYVHNATAATGKPIAGVNRGRRIAMEAYRSTVYGHHHMLDCRVVPLLGNGSVARMALNAPAFMQEDNIEEWAKDNQLGWQYGLLLIDPTDSLTKPFSFEWMRTERLISEYL